MRLKVDKTNEIIKLNKLVEEAKFEDLIKINVNDVDTKKTHEFMFSKSLLEKYMKHFQDKNRIENH